MTAAPWIDVDADFSESIDHLVTLEATQTRSPSIVLADSVSLVSPPMLIRGWIPRGAITVLAGQPGAGKGVVVADVIARASRGDVMPNGDKLAGPFRSLIVCGPGEDGAADWRLRLVAAETKPGACWIVESVVDEIGFNVPVTAKDLPAILNHAANHRIDLVVIDSLGAVAGDIDLNKTEIRDRLLNSLANTAKATGVAVLLIHHTRKSGGDALSVVSGSTQITAAARGVLVAALERDTDNEERFLVVAKLNGARRSNPIAFTTAGRPINGDDGHPLRDDRGDPVLVPVVAWSDRTVTHAEADAAVQGLPGHRDDAADALRDALANGPIRSVDLEAEMAEAGFTKDQTKRVRQRLGATAIKIAQGDLAGWWTCPPGTPRHEARDLIEQTHLADQ